MVEPQTSVAPESAPLIGAAPLALAPAKRWAGRFPLALSFALLAHVAVAAPLLLSRVATTGAGGVDREAISVDVVVVPASAIESRVAAAPAVAAASAIEQDAGPAETPPVVDATPPEVTKPIEPEVRATETAPPPLDPTAVDVAEAKPELEPARPEPYQKSDAAPAPPPPANSGGVASFAADVVPAAVAAPAVAAPGSAERYARSVVEALGKTRPKVTASGLRGLVKVTFAIADDGAVEFARVTASSGSVALDAAALSAVQRVSFPTPPVGLSRTQLTYEIPYRFR